MLCGIMANNIIGEEDEVWSKGRFQYKEEEKARVQSKDADPSRTHRFKQKKTEGPP